MNDIVKKVRNRREELGYSCADVVRLLQLHGVDITYRSYARFENGQNMLHLTKFMELCNILCLDFKEVP